MVNVVMIVALLTDLIHRHLNKDVQWDAEIQKWNDENYWPNILPAHHENLNWI